MLGMICYLYLGKVMGLKMDMDFMAQTVQRWIAFLFGYITNPVDNTMLVFLILVHWIATYAEDRAIQLLNN